MTAPTSASSSTGPSKRMISMTEPIARRAAGRRFLPVWAVVHHTGRKTGRALTVPVAVLATADEFLIGLPWGPDTNWARNVLAAGGCTLRWKGAVHHASEPRIVGAEEARRFYGRFSWAMAKRLFRTDHFLLLQRP